MPGSIEKDQVTLNVAVTRETSPGGALSARDASMHGQKAESPIQPTVSTAVISARFGMKPARKTPAAKTRAPMPERR